MDYAIAVLDVGKTNKKLLIFDEDLNLLDSTYRQFTPQPRDGIPVEDLDGLLEWFYGELGRFAARYPIRSISCATHGAAFVGVDESGRQTLPLVDYTYEPGEAFHERFYELAGDRETLQRTTATLELKALINPAKGLLFAREQYPEEFDRTRWFLPFPSFFAMQLTGIPSAEWTYVGCHTYLWDFEHNTWSQVADRLGIRERLPDNIARPYDRLGTIRPEVAERTGLPADTVVPHCIHDSNAALLPYLVTEQEPFLLNSTGTWCVVMRPAEQVAFAEEEIGKSVFYNLSANGTPVKTAILMAGLEFETYTGILRSLHNVDTLPGFNPDVYKRVVAEKSAFILPSIVVGSGQFPDSRPRVVEGDSIYELEEIRNGTRIPSFFQDLETAYAVLNLSIVAQSVVAFSRVGAGEVTHAYTEGGFRNNTDYNALMASLFPEQHMSLTGIPEASAFGAAMSAKTAHDGGSVDDLAKHLSIEKESIQAAEIDGVQEYLDRFLELV